MRAMWVRIKALEIRGVKEEDIGENKRVSRKAGGEIEELLFKKQNDQFNFTQMTFGHGNK